MKKIMLKKPQRKEILTSLMVIGGFYAIAYYSTGSVAIGIVWSAISILAGAIGIVAMKVFGTTY